MLLPAFSTNFWASRLAADVIWAAFLADSLSIESASPSAVEIKSAASSSAAEIYLRPRDSADERILFALFSAASNFSFVFLVVSVTRRCAAALALLRVLEQT